MDAVGDRERAARGIAQIGNLRLDSIAHIGKINRIRPSQSRDLASEGERVVELEGAGRAREGYGLRADTGDLGAGTFGDRHRWCRVGIGIPGRRAGVARRNRRGCGNALTCVCRRSRRSSLSRNERWIVDGHCPENVSDRFARRQRIDICDTVVGDSSRECISYRCFQQDGLCEQVRVCPSAAVNAKSCRQGPTLGCRFEKVIPEADKTLRIKPCEAWPTALCDSNVFPEATLFDNKMSSGHPPLQSYSESERIMCIEQAFVCLNLIRLAAIYAAKASAQRDTAT